MKSSSLKEKAEVVEVGLTINTPWMTLDSLLGVFSEVLLAKPGE